MLHKEEANDTMKWQGVREGPGSSTFPGPGRDIQRRYLFIGSPYVSGGKEKATFLVLGMWLFLIDGMETDENAENVFMDSGTVPENSIVHTIHPGQGKYSM